MNFSSINDTELPTAADNLLQRLTDATASERQLILIAYIQEQVTRFVGISVEELDVHQSLNYLGIDSLIAVKLRNQLRTDLQVEVAVVQFMQDASVIDLATEVSEKIIAGNREDSSQQAMDDDDLLEGEL